MKITTTSFICYLQLVTSFGFPYDNSYKKLYRALWSLFPPNLLSQALKLLGDATSTPEDKGISWSERGQCGPYQSSDCVMTIVRFIFLFTLQKVTPLKFLIFRSDTFK